jgi:hypothetical protein
LIDTGTQLSTEEGAVPLGGRGTGSLSAHLRTSAGCHGSSPPKIDGRIPEIRLNIFPGLGGTQRLPRRTGLLNAEDPVGGDAAITAILQGKNFPARKAAALRMIDAVIPAGRTRRVRGALRARGLPRLRRHPPTWRMPTRPPMVFPPSRRRRWGG